MSTHYSKFQITREFDKARSAYDALEHWLASEEAAVAEHAQLEVVLEAEGRELLRLLLQSHLDLRAAHERRRAVVGDDGIERRHVRKTERSLMTIFGPVRVRRLGYSARQTTSRFPTDMALNLPRERYSYGLRRRVAIEAAKGAFDDVVVSVRAHTGGQVAKRQAEQLVARAACDFDAFYERQKLDGPEPTQDLLVLSVDSKGVVMRTQDLRAETRRAAMKSKNKLKKRLSRGEARNRKRMATVATVYSIEARARMPDEVMNDLRAIRDTSQPRPRARNKRVWASVEKSAEHVIDQMFQEALRRDPEQKRTWVVLVDGAIKQRELIELAAQRHGVAITIVLDFIHMIERIWSVAWRFFKEGDRQIEVWVRERTIRVLQGHVKTVVAGIRRKATLRGLQGSDRKAIKTATNYLISNSKLMVYNLALAAGWPIATGVIEGACRHLVKDRMDITGARWSLQGAEAVLRLRALRASRDFDAYWPFHLEKEWERQHVARYAASALIAA